jgi:hypothetical protein
MHERHCKAERMTDAVITEPAQPPEAEPKPPEEPKEVIQSSARVILKESKGWKLIQDGDYQMIDTLGRILGRYHDEKEALRTFDNMLRHVR